MGRGVTGGDYHACMESGCPCVDYICVVDTWTDEERAMRIVHHPRNHPEYVQCACGHQMIRHFTDPKSRAMAATKIDSLRALLIESAPELGAAAVLGGVLGPATRRVGLLGLYFQRAEAARQVRLGGGALPGRRPRHERHPALRRDGRRRAHGLLAYTHCRAAERRMWQGMGVTGWRTGVWWHVFGGSDGRRLGAG